MRELARSVFRAASRGLRAAGRLLRVGPSGWVLLLRAQVALLRAERRVRGQPQGTLFRDIARTAPAPGSSSGTDPRHRVRVEEIGDAVDRMARWGVSRPLCLARSLAYRELLEREDIPGSWVRVGVRMGPRGFEAHAWVEWEGQVVGENPAYVAAFAPLADSRSEARPERGSGPRTRALVDPGAEGEASLPELPWAETGAPRHA
jgi:hypothetical protein